MIGQAAGARGTVKIHNWTQHLAWILDHPDSRTPIANVDLLWAAVPEHHSGDANDSERASQDSERASATGKNGDAGAAQSRRQGRRRQQQGAAFQGDGGSNARLTTSNVTTHEPSSPPDPDEIEPVRACVIFVDVLAAASDCMMSVLQQFCAARPQRCRDYLSALF